VAVGSGYNNYKPDGAASSTGAQAMFFLSVDKAASAAWAEGTNYFKVVLPVSSTSTVNGMVNPGFVTGPNGEASLLYVGDLQGNMWKIDLSNGISSSNLNTSVFQASGVRKPIFVAEYPTGTRQPITTAPQVIRGERPWATWSSLAPASSWSRPTRPPQTQQSIYGIWDSLETSATELHRAPQQALCASRPRCPTARSPWAPPLLRLWQKTPGSTAAGLIDLPETRERISVESALGIGAVIFSAAIPEGTCSGDGYRAQILPQPCLWNQRVWQFCLYTRDPQRTEDFPDRVG
jgi:type IV pilus assembly protein PilY1